MPRRAGPSRSLFASLPVDLKQTLRSQTFGNPANDLDDVQIKAENILNISTNGLLNTQPDSDDEEDEEEEIANQVAGPSGISSITINTQPSYSSESIPSISRSMVVKRKREENATPNIDPSTYITINQNHLQKKRKKGKQNNNHNEIPLNPYIEHPWDCTGLVKRYSNYRNVPKDLIKYYAQRKLYFPLYDELPLLLDETGWFSITPQPIAKHIAERCSCDLIIDAFCGVGGNTIEFAKTCERVIAIDNDLTRLKLARHNALHHGVADRIEFIHGDFINFTQSFIKSNKGREEIVDVVFLSPPWGGIDYLNTESSTFPLSSILPISGKELFELTLELTPNISYYLPKNTDLKELSNLANTLKPQDTGQDGTSRTKEWVEIEEEWVGDKLKAITAYYGGLVSVE
ncbi:uncharacterized protein L201_007706 [Kwoniella dendrophila CBS 6074]|uniref:Trimethylguanosine synthase n=1 Tax=Kwoniella dendrophila CBS 6074 TaxID=1295534 RepID=A0AAX4K528_9TREE